MTHTPTPWKVAGKIYIDGNDGLPLARCQGLKGKNLIEDQNNQDQAEANAAHIVKCVNAHDELVKIARAYRNLLRTMAQDEGEVATFDHIEGILERLGEL